MIIPDRVPVSFVVKRQNYIDKYVCDMYENCEWLQTYVYIQFVRNFAEFLNRKTFFV